MDDNVLHIYEACKYNHIDLDKYRNNNNQIDNNRDYNMDNSTHRNNRNSNNGVRSQLFLIR